MGQWERPCVVIWCGIKEELFISLRGQMNLAAEPYGCMNVGSVLRTKETGVGVYV
jgi:hypothetical protein